MFGHLGDTKGRGYCLLVSVLLMGIPTVLIGCLPSYKQIGIAAPILLALLRLAQGLAMGGEFGACMCAHHRGSSCCICASAPTQYSGPCCCLMRLAQALPWCIWWSWLTRATRRSPALSATSPSAPAWCWASS